MQHGGKHDIVNVLALAPNKPIVLNAAAARPHAADLQLIKCHYASSPRSARIFSAAHNTDFTMF